MTKVSKSTLIVLFSPLSVMVQAFTQLIAPATSLAACACVNQAKLSLFLSNSKINCPGVSGEEIHGFFVQSIVLRYNSMVLANAIISQN